MLKLIEKDFTTYNPVDTWYVEVENETGNETDAQLDAMIENELAKIPSSAPTGSIAEILIRKNPRRKGVNLKMKSSQGDWIDL